MVGTLEEHPSRFTAVEMTIAATTGDGGELERLVAMAERGCIVANTLRTVVELRSEAVARTAA